MAEEKKQLRELNGGDLFPVLNIIGKLDVKDELIKLFGGGDARKVDPEKLELLTKGKTEEEAAEIEKAEVEKQGLVVATELFQALFTQMDAVKYDLANFLGSLSGQTGQEVLELPLDQFTNLIVEFKNKPELSSFFKSISSLM